MCPPPEPQILQTVVWVTDPSAPESLKVELDEIGEVAAEVLARAGLNVLHEPIVGFGGAGPIIEHAVASGLLSLGLGFIGKLAWEVTRPALGWLVRRPERELAEYRVRTRVYLYANNPRSWRVLLATLPAVDRKLSDDYPNRLFEFAGVYSYPHSYATFQQPVRARSIKSAGDVILNAPAGTMTFAASRPAWWPFADVERDTARAKMTPEPPSPVYRPKHPRG